MMSRERFLDAADAVRREEADAQRIADFIDTFSTSVSIVLRTSPAVNFIVNMMIEEFHNEESIMAYFFPVFPEDTKVFYNNDGSKIIVNDDNEFYNFLVKNAQWSVVMFYLADVNYGADSDKIIVAAGNYTEAMSIVERDYTKHNLTIYSISIELLNDTNILTIPEDLDIEGLKDVQQEVRYGCICDGRLPHWGAHRR